MFKVKNLALIVFAALLCVTMAFAIPAEAAGTNEAKIGETEYATLEEAVADAAEGDTIVLLKAVVVGNGETLTIDKNVTITTTVTDAFTVNAGGILNLKKVTINSTSSILWANGGTINIDGATLTATGSPYAVAFAEKESQINIKSGTIESKNSKAVTIDVTDEKTTVTISDGKVLHDSSSAIAARNKAVVNINGGEVKTTDTTDACYSAAYVFGGAQINVAGGEISSANGDALIAAADGKVAVSGGTVKGVRAHGNANASVTISGGIINGSVTAANDATVTVTGGSFEQDVTEFCAAAARIGNVYYATLEEAVADAAEGDTIVLLKAVVVGNDETLTIDKNVTITTTVTDAFTVNAGGTLNLNKVTISSTSSILWANGGVINIDGAILTTTGSQYSVAFAENNGQINMKSGTIEAKNGTSTTISVKGATVTIEGGKILNDTVSAISARNNAIVNIKGGEIKTTAEEAYCAVLAGSGAQINVTGGEISAVNGYGLVAIADGKVTVSGGTVNGVLAHENAGASATISGGTINGNVAVNNGASLAITGGSFEKNVTELCGEGYHTVKGEGDRYVYGAHVFSTEWVTDAEKHWHECDCGAVADDADHIYENNVCTDCGMKDGIPPTGDSVLVFAAAFMMLSAAVVVLLNKKRLMA